MAVAKSIAVADANAVAYAARNTDSIQAAGDKEMKWYYWLIVLIVAAVVVFAYYQYSHAQTPQPSASATVFQRATQPYSSPTASPTPAPPMPPMKLKHP